MTAIVRYDLKERTARVRDFSEVSPENPWLGLPSEPIMVPRPGENRDEDDGYLLTLVYHPSLDGVADVSALHVLSARDLSTLCVARLPHHVPPGFHGCFVPVRGEPPSRQAAPQLAGQESAISQTPSQSRA
jgi:carotenoid cleavage dioxygenase-like enzyme